VQGKIHIFRRVVLDYLAVRDVDVAAMFLIRQNFSIHLSSPLMK
jgi:hypothetical protein